MLTQQEIARLRALCERATDAPWEFASPGGTMFYVVSHESMESIAEVTFRYDAEFIAASREALPKLLDEVERLQGEVDDLDALLNELGYTRL